MIMNAGQSGPVELDRNPGSGAIIAPDQGFFDSLNG